MDMVLCSVPVRIFYMLGVRTLLVSNAAGGINPNFGTASSSIKLQWSHLAFGDLMLLKDHIFMPGLCGLGPLVGLNDPRFGPRFVSVHDAYDIELRFV